MASIKRVIYLFILICQFRNSRGLSQGMQPIDSACKVPIKGDETRNGVPARAETSDVRAGVSGP